MAKHPKGYHNKYSRYVRKKAACAKCQRQEEALLVKLNTPSRKKKSGGVSRGAMKSFRNMFQPMQPALEKAVRVRKAREPKMKKLKGTKFMGTKLKFNEAGEPITKRKRSKALASWERGF